jgi:hypothetical protein
MWDLKIKEVQTNIWHEVIYNNYTQEIVAVVDILNKEFVNKIIEDHNKTLSRWYKDGLKDGVEVARNSKNI